ncbi:MAG: hypothetical protein JWM95_4554 [Gemmatimonadetes bacterium]|nr:hypothetical protein [Gemmatimonadota bacterium]
MLVAVPRMSSQIPDTARVTSRRIIGVFDAQSAAPLEGVQVRNMFSGTFALTSSTGTAHLGLLAASGTASIIELRKLGYQPKHLFIGSEDTTSVTEVLERLVELAPIVTTERYRVDRDAGLWAGFEQRCQSGSATCFRAEDLAKRPSVNLADFLVHAPGMTIGACGGGPRDASRNSQCGVIAMHSLIIPPAYCQPTFFIDGHEWNARLGAATDLRPNTPATAPYTPANVKAIEVYPSERARPARFRGNAMCGVVAIWTK